MADEEKNETTEEPQAEEQAAAEQAAPEAQAVDEVPAEEPAADDAPAAEAPAEDAPAEEAPAVEAEAVEAPAEEAAPELIWTLFFSLVIWLTASATEEVGTSRMMSTPSLSPTPSVRRPRTSRLLPASR